MTAATRDDCICRVGFFKTVKPGCPLCAPPQAVAIWDKLNTYAPDASACIKGHPFASEADCVLPEDWDYFMCRTCIIEAVAAGSETP